MKDRRRRFREGLHRLYLPFYAQLCEALPDHWQPTEGFRSFERQADLYAKGRTIPGTAVVTQAPPGKSLHNYGLASDWAYFPEGKYTEIGPVDPRWQEYMDTCKRLGLKLITWDKPHNEYPLKKISVGLLYEAARDWGDSAVAKLLEEEMNHG
jgi:hypothetical protein